MQIYLSRLRTFFQDRRAVTALEYGIIASALGLVLLVIFQKLSTPISSVMSGVGGSI